MLTILIWLLTASGLSAIGIASRVDRARTLAGLVFAVAIAGAALTTSLSGLAAFASLIIAWVALSLLGSRLAPTRRNSLAFLLASVVLLPSMLDLLVSVPPPPDLRPIGMDGLWLLNGLFLGSVGVVAVNEHTRIMGRRGELTSHELDRLFVGLYLLVGCLGLAGFSVAALAQDAALLETATAFEALGAWWMHLASLASVALVCVAVALWERSRVLAVAVSALGAAGAIALAVALVSPLSLVAVLIGLLVVASVVDSQLSMRALNFLAPSFSSVWIAASVGVAVATPLAVTLSVAETTSSATNAMLQFVPWAFLGGAAVVYSGTAAARSFRGNTLTQNSVAFNLFHDWVLTLGAFSLGALLPILAPHSGSSTFVFVLGILSISGVNSLITMIMRNTVEHATDETVPDRQRDAQTPTDTSKALERLKSHRAVRQLGVAGAIALIGWGYFVVNGAAWQRIMWEWLTQLSTHLAG